METHYLHVLKIKLFAAWDLACPYVNKLFLSASRLIETWLFWELIGFIAMETNSISSLCQSCYLWFTESTSKLLFKKKQKTKTLLYLLFQSTAHYPLSHSWVQHPLQERKIGILAMQCQVTGFHVDEKWGDLHWWHRQSRQDHQQTSQPHPGIKIPTKKTSLIQLSSPPWVSEPKCSLMIWNAEQLFSNP